MSIEQDLNRIAIALETIAEHIEKIATDDKRTITVLPEIPRVYKDPPERMKEVGMPAQQEAESPQVTLARNAGIPVTIQAAAESSAAVPAMTEREILMSECDRLNLPYPAKASVKRLKEILETYGKKGAQLPLEETKTSAPNTTAAFETKNYTKPEAKEILMRFAAKYGMDKAMKVITDFGQKDLSGVEAAGKLNELVEKTLKLEADHGKK